MHPGDGQTQSRACLWRWVDPEDAGPSGAWENKDAATRGTASVVAFIEWRVCGSLRMRRIHVTQHSVRGPRRVYPPLRRVVHPGWASLLLQPTGCCSWLLQPTGCCSWLLQPADCCGWLKPVRTGRPSREERGTAGELHCSRMAQHPQGYGDAGARPEHFQAREDITQCCEDSTAASAPHCEDGAAASAPPCSLSPTL